jgi:glycosyltransferase involved in cell wall biosynthesis
MPLRILMITRALGRARGISAVAFALAEQWRQRGIEVTTFCLQPPDDAGGTDIGTIESCPRLAALCRAIPSRRMRLLLEVPLFTRLATRRARRARDCFVIVQGDGEAGDLFVAHSCHRAALDAKRAAHRRAFRFWPLHRYLLARERRIATGTAPARIVAVSDEVAADFARLYATPPQRLLVIENGVDPDRFRPAPDREALRRRLGLPTDGPLLLFAGQQFETKGLRIALQALARVRAQPAPLLLVAGEDGAAPFRRLAAELGLAPRVLFLGLLRDLAPHMAAADLLLLLSEYEAFGLVGLEALASGVPVVATRTGGIGAYLHDGVNGHFVQREPAALALLLDRLLSDRKALARLAGRARESALAFAWSGVAARYAALASPQPGEARP